MSRKSLAHFSNGIVVVVVVVVTVAVKSLTECAADSSV